MNPDGPTTPDAPPRRRTVPLGAFVLSVLVAGALAVLAVVALTVDDSDADRDVREVRLAAAHFAERFLGFHHSRMDDWERDVRALVTGSFADQVDEVESDLRRLIADNEVEAAAQVRDTYVGQIDRGAVDVVVVYDRRVDGARGARTEKERYMQVTFLRVEGSWLVDDVVDIAVAGSAPVPPSADAPGSADPRPTTTPDPTAGTGG